MNQLEKVEKIREKTGVSYEDAKVALEAAGGDILDAIVYLENQGKIKKPEVQFYTTEKENTSQAFEEAAKAYDKQDDESLSGIARKFFDWCRKMIRLGCENFFIVTKHEKEIITAPVIVLVLLLVTAFWIIVPILVVGLFFGYRYSFKGVITKSVDVNKACDVAAEACENIKKEFSQKPENKENK